MAHNRRKAEAVLASVKYEERVQHSIRWHRNQDHLRHLSDDKLRVLIEAKWQDRKERDQKRRTTAKKRYADQKAAKQNVITCYRINNDGEDKRQELEGCRPASKTDEATVTKKPSKTKLGPNMSRPYPKIETKRKRILLKRNPAKPTSQK